MTPDPAQGQPQEQTLPDVTTAQTTVYVQRTTKRAKQPEEVIDEDPEVIAVHKFVTQPAMVQFATSHKKAHDYCSSGVTIGVTLPCYVSEVSDAYEAAEEIVMERLKKRLPDIIRAAFTLAEAKPEA